MATKTNTEELNRCRLILTASPKTCSEDALISAVRADDVASVILYAADSEEHAFDAFCTKLVPILQTHECAVLVADNTQISGRSGADGVFLEKTKSTLADTIARFSPHNIVGCGGAKDRHKALQIGELKPDVVFFGKLGGDIKPDPHPKNIALGQWWADLIEIPGIVMGGLQLESIIECANTGVDFVALEKAVFSTGDAADNVARANALLNEYAPLLDEEDV